jgi:excisionase family DNA binding protein
MRDHRVAIERTVVMELRLTDDELQRMALRIVELLRLDQLGGNGWRDVAGAGAHVGLTENAIRNLVKRRQIPFHRTPNGRLRFSETELDEWVRTGSCAPTNEDLR